MSKPKLNEIYRSVALENNDGKVEDMLNSKELKGLDSLNTVNQGMIKDYIKSHITKKLAMWKSTTDNEEIIKNIDSISKEDIENIAVKSAEENKNISNYLFINYKKPVAQLKKLVRGEEKKEEREEERPVQDSEEKQEGQTPVVMKDAVGVEYDIPTNDGIYKVHNPNGLKSIVYVEVKTDIPTEDGKEKVTTKKVILVDKSPSKEDLDSLSKNTYVEVSEDQRKRILSAVSTGSLKHDFDLSSYDLSEETQNINSEHSLGRDDPQAIKETINAKLDMVLSGVKNSGSAGRYLRGLAVNTGGLSRAISSSRSQNDGYVKINNMWSAFGVYHNITRDLSEKNLKVYAPRGKEGNKKYRDNIIEGILGGMVESILPHLISSVKRLLVPSNKRNPFYTDSAKIPDSVAKILSSMVYGENYTVNSKPNPRYGSYQKRNGSDQIEKGYDGSVFLALNYKNISSDIDQNKFTYDNISNWLVSGADKTISAMIRNSAAEQTNEIILNDSKRITKFISLAQEAINRMTGNRFLDFMNIPKGNIEDADKAINQAMDNTITKHNSKSYTNDAVEDIIHKNVKLSFEDADNDGNQDDIVVGSRTYSAQTDREDSKKSMRQWFNSNKESNQQEHEYAKSKNWYKTFFNYFNAISGKGVKSKSLSTAKGKEITDDNFFFGTSRHASFARECLYKTFAELNKSGRPDSSFSYSDEGSKTPDAFVSNIIGQVRVMIDAIGRKYGMQNHEAIKDTKKEDSIKRALQIIMLDEAKDKNSEKYGAGYEQKAAKSNIVSEILYDFPQYYVPAETEKVAKKVFSHLEKRFDEYFKGKAGFAQSKASDDQAYTDKESLERVYGDQEDITVSSIQSDAEDLEKADDYEDEYEDEYEDDIDEDDFF